MSPKIDLYKTRFQPILPIDTLINGPPLFGLYPNGLYPNGLSLNGLQGQLDYPQLDYL